jgi:hypothetical protein
MGREKAVMSFRQAIEDRKDLLRSRASDMFRWIALELDVFLNNNGKLKIKRSEDVDAKLDRLANSTMDLKADGKSILLTAYDDTSDMNVGRESGSPETRQPQLEAFGSEPPLLGVMLASTSSSE